MAKMGIGVLGGGTHFKRRFRWIFDIPEVTLNESSGEGAKLLPPEKSARPNLQFKEMSVHHQAEDVYYPAKPDWKTVNLTLYDIAFDPHPVFKWIKKFYDPQIGTIYAPNENKGTPEAFIKTVFVRMYNGCGEMMEEWVWEDTWLQNANFQTLDMGDSGIVMCDITLRYARAFIDFEKDCKSYTYS
jgi:hypothetical protein